jgi:hypothetical protein
MGYLIRLVTLAAYQTAILKKMQFSKMNVVGNSGQNNNYFLQIHPRFVQWPFQLA